MFTFTIRTLILFGLVFIFSTAQGQLAINYDGIILLGKYKMGDSISKFGHDVGLVSSYGSKIDMYQYLPSLKEPIEIGNKQFRFLLLDFDTSGRLVNLHFSKSYEPQNFKRESRSDFKSLTTFFNAAFKKNGIRKVYYRNVHEGYEWTIPNILVVVDLQQTGKRESTSVGISFRQQL
jgi:hypothetical protein